MGGTLYATGLRSLCFLFLCAQALGHSPHCKPVLNAVEELTQEQILALHEAPFPFQLMEANVNGKRRLVVILGEVHIQDQFSHDKGKQVIDAFPNRGVETFQGGIFWKAAIRLAYAIEGLFSGRSAGSNIVSSRVQAKAGAYAKKLVERYKLKEKTLEELKAFKRTLYGREYTGEELIKLAEAAPVNVNLEKGFVPTLSEWAKAWGVPLIMLGERFAWIPGLAALPLYLNGHETAATIAGFGGLFSWLGFAFANTAGIPGELGTALAPRRDQHMGNSIDQFFRDNDDKSVMLVIVGRSHIHGIQDELQQKGYQPIYKHPKPVPSKP